GGLPGGPGGGLGGLGGTIGLVHLVRGAPVILDHQNPPIGRFGLGLSARDSTLGGLDGGLSLGEIDGAIAVRAAEGLAGRKGGGQSLFGLIISSLSTEFEPS